MSRRRTGPHRPKPATWGTGATGFEGGEFSSPNEAAVSLTQAAKMMNVSQRSAKRAGVVRTQGVHALQQSVQDGEVFLHAAAEVVALGARKTCTARAAIHILPQCPGRRRASAFGNAATYSQKALRLRGARSRCR